MRGMAAFFYYFFGKSNYAAKIRELNPEIRILKNKCD